MLPRVVIGFLAAGIALSAWAGPGTVVRIGENWHYHKTEPGAAPPHARWMQRDFDEAAWDYGPSGYVLPEEELDARSHRRKPAKRAHVYVRKTFRVTDPKSVRTLLLRAEHEVGFRAYLNGVEIARVSGPGVHVPTDAERAGGMEDAQMLPVEIDVSRYANLLVVGDNVLALEGPSSGESESAFPLAAMLSMNFTRGPFVQNASTSGIQVFWRTGVPGSTWLEYGPSAALGLSVTNGTPVTNHVVTLTGLAPDTTYNYRCHTDTGSGVISGDVEHFRTLKTRGPITFMVFGDSGQATVAQLQLAGVLLTNYPDLVLHGGDVIYNGWTDPSADLRCFNYYQPQMRSVPFYFAVGNHDLNCCTLTNIGSPAGDLVPGNIPASATNFQNAFYLPTNSATGTEHYYSFDHGDVHFVCLFEPWFSAYTLTVGDTQYNWLTNDLARSTKPWKFLFDHMPVANSGNHANRDLNFNVTLDRVELMNLLLPVAQQYGVQLMFSGHEHNFERFAPTNGFHHVVSGGGGVGLYAFTTRHAASAQYWAENHVTMVTVNGDTISIQALRTDGTVLDSMVINRVLPAPRVYSSTWNTPVLETTVANNGDGNIVGQTFNLTGTPILGRHGKFSNLGEFYVNNDSTNLYLGFKNAMYYTNNNLFLFVESPRLAGVSTMAGQGNGLIDPAGQGVDGLDCLENLSFTNFAPSVACLVGDEYGDGNFRSFVRSNLALNIGQGVFLLNTNLSTVTSARLQQFNRSPEATAAVSEKSEQSADLIEICLPFSALGGVQPGDIIKVGAVAGGFNYIAAAQKRELDTACLGTFLAGSGTNPVVLGAVSVRLAFPPNLDTDDDGLLDNWELAYGLDPNSATGDDGANGDPDHDGYTNAQEQLAGTDPRDPNSSLRLSLTPVAPNHYRVAWKAVAGKKYQLEYANGPMTNFTSMASGAWPRVGVFPEEIFEDDLSTTAPPPSLRTYRVRLVP